MSIFKTMARMFSLRSVLDADQMLAKEKEHVDECFKEFFDEKFSEYLQTDYQRYLTRDYPELLRQRGYDYIKPDNYPEKERPGYALALTGGGIRSASFGIGVMQALNSAGLFGSKPTIFKKLRFLSTVSGGGYSGCALTWYSRLFNLFPFGVLSSFAGSKDSTGEENKTLSYIRTHGNYLIPHALGRKGLIANVLMGVTHSTVVYTLLFATFFYVFMAFIRIDTIREILTSLEVHSVITQIGSIDFARLGFENMSEIRVRFATLFISLSASLATLFFLLTFVYAAASFFSHSFSLAHGTRVRMQWLEGRLLLGSVAAFALALVPLLAHQIFGLVVDVRQDGAAIGVMSGSGLTATFLAFKQLRASNINSADGKPGIVDKVLGIVAVPLFIASLLAVSFLLAETFLEQENYVTFLIVAGIFLLALTVNIDQISPHKMYRDRLMEAFLKKPGVEPTASLERRAEAANATRLCDLATSAHWSPYPLINCNLILTNAIAPHYRARVGDSFVLSPLFCGSTATQYVETTDFDNGNMTLPTAMAISGAAANPHAGNSGEGKSTLPAVSYLMTFFGLRLGYWTFNPSSRMSFISKLLKPNYMLPGLASLLGIHHNERNLFIELSDGGHFDNTGVYELIRRRVPVIIVADGGSDPEDTFDSIGNVIERCRVDFGTSIRFPDPDYDLASVLPNSMCARAIEEANLYDSKYGLAVRGFALGDIVYPDIAGKPAFVGRMVYIKTCMIRGLPGDLYSYKSANPTYPNQSTIDQFFDERQFESYRELGYQLTRQLITDPVAMRKLP